VRGGEVSAGAITEDALARLDAVNPAINAVIAEFPDEARAAAAQVDAARVRGEDPGPLAGVPVTVKVNVDQIGHATTNGLRTQRDLIAREDNPVVSNLRRAGAVIIGRTNTPAFSLRWFCRNGLHGHTFNPRDRSRTPGGSSGGAAAALVTGIGAIAHGTDIGGSVRYPAYACGVHGLRPTLGRIPAWNPSGPDRHVGAQLMAVSGPLARTIDDVRLAFAAMAARDVRDPWWMPVPLEQPPQPRRAALTVAPEELDVVPAVARALHDAAARLRDGGWQVDEVACPPLREPAGLQLRLWLAEFRRGAAAAIEREADPDASFIYQQMTEMCPAPDLAGLLDTLQSRVGLMRQWQQFLDEYPVLICPVSAELPFPDQLDIESPAAFRRVFEAQLTQVALPFLGLPGLTVSTGMAGTVPVGVQLIGGRYREDTLLAAGEIIAARGAPPSPIDP
jgi:amidase